MNWDEAFKSAHETSWPVPCLSMQTAIYERDQKEIDACAKKHGYKFRRVFNSDGIEVLKGVREFFR